MLFLYYILAANPTPVPHPSGPTWENLVPWVVGFCFTLVSSVLWWITREQNKKLDANTDEIKKMGYALNVANKIKLLEMAADPALHNVVKTQAQSLLQETENALTPK